MMRNSEAKHIDTTEIDGLIEGNPKWGFSNVDLIAERKGKFLIQEWKRPDEGVSVGQRGLLSALAATPWFTVLIVTGYTDGTAMTVESVDYLPKLSAARWDGGSGQLTHIGNSVADLQRAIQGWYAKVDGGGL